MSILKTNKIETLPGSSPILTIPMLTQTPQLYSFSGTAYFDTIVNNLTYQPVNYNAAIKRYANLGPGSTFGPNGAVATSHGLNASSVNAATWCADKNLFNVIAGCQLWRVPVSGTYTLTTKGAGRNSSFAGFGISLTCNFYLYAGEWLRIVCGAQGQTDGSTFGGGNGASCISVFRDGMHMPVLIAGGGAGTSGNSPQSNNTNRNATPPMSDNGEDTTFSGTGFQYAARDGMGGRGSFYSADYPSYILNWAGGGGGGWATKGGGGGIGINQHEGTAGGAALSSACPHGGFYQGATPSFAGGFGGGGATGVSSGSAGGGGGWYGGNATFAISTTSDDTTALGGGSYCAANSFTNNGTHGTFGQVEVSL
jgi:hypothetical protein